jgi:Protein of unknown function (DUF1036)
VSLSFSNSTPGPISLVYAHNDSDCGSGGDAWMKEGWWSIPPGGTVTVRSGPVNGAKYFFFAEGGTGQTWAGEFTTTVPFHAFSQLLEHWHHRQPAGVHAQDRGCHHLVQPHRQPHHLIAKEPHKPGRNR